MISETRFSIEYEISDTGKYIFPYPYEDTDSIKGYGVTKEGYIAPIKENYYFDGSTNTFIYPTNGQKAEYVKILLRRQTPVVSSLSVPNGYPFYGIEKEFTKHTMWIQEISKQMVDTHNDARHVDIVDNDVTNMKAEIIRKMDKATLDCTTERKLAKRWAECDESPNGEQDTESPTNKTQSSKSWALQSKRAAEDCKEKETEIKTIVADGKREAANMISTVQQEKNESLQAINTFNSRLAEAKSDIENNMRKAEGEYTSYLDTLNQTGETTVQKVISAENSATGEISRLKDATQGEMQRFYDQCKYNLNGVTLQHLNELQNKKTELVSQLNNTYTENYNTLNELGKKCVQNVNAEYEKDYATLKTLSVNTTDTVQTINNIVSTTKEFIQNHENNITDVTGGYVQKIVDKCNESVRTLADTAQQEKKILTDTQTQLIAELNNNAQTHLNAFGINKQEFTGAIETAKNKAVEAINQTKDTNVGIISQTGNELLDKMTGLKSATQNNADTVTNNLQSIQSIETDVKNVQSGILNDKAEITHLTDTVRQQSAEIKTIHLNSLQVKDYTEQAHNAMVSAKKYAEQTKHNAEGNWVKSVNSKMPDSNGNVAIDLSLYAPMSYVDTATQKAVNGVNQSFETKLNAYQSAVTDKIATSKSNFDEILKDYARKTDVPNQIDLSGYATKEQITTVTENISAAQNSLNAVNQQINNLNNTASILRSDVTSNKAVLNNIGNIYAKKSDMPDMSIYAKTTAIPSLSNYVQKTDLNIYAKKSDMPDMTAYAKKSDIPTAPSTVDDYCVPDGTETVTNGMFGKYHLTEKTYLCFPPSVKKIDKFSYNMDPFKDNKQSLKAVFLPQCRSVGDNVFGHCSSLKEAFLPQCMYLGQAAFCKDNSLEMVVLSQCTYLEEYALDHCSSLKEALLPQCTYLGDSALGYCSSLTNVFLPQCMRLNNGAFYQCSKLYSIYLPQCGYLGLSVFGECSNLVYIDLPQCTSVGDYTFKNCSSLSELYINEKVKLNNFDGWNVPKTCMVYNETKTKKLINGKWVSI